VVGLFFDAPAHRFTLACGLAAIAVLGLVVGLPV